MNEGKMKVQLLVSIVIPVYNSSGIQNELYRRLVTVLKKSRYDYEIIFVNDGSSDNSSDVIRLLCEKDKNVKLLAFSRNFGHQAAISAGLERARGDIIVIMDDDLQDPPEVLPAFFERIREGYEVVYGIRKRRKERILKRAAFYVFYRMLRAVSSHDIPPDSGDFCVVSRKTVEVLRGFAETNQFLRGLRSWIGFKQVGIEYERGSRYEGKSQYTLTKYVRFALSAIFSFSYLPLRISTFAGLTIALMSIFYAVFIIYKKIAGHIDNVPGFAALFVAVSLIGGVILISLGIIGEYIARMYDELKRRPRYIIKEQIGFD